MLGYDGGVRFVSERRGGSNSSAITLAHFILNGWLVASVNFTRVSDCHPGCVCQVFSFRVSSSLGMSLHGHHHREV